MENQVEEIKKKLDIVEIINRYLPLKKRGRHFLACCPFHGEKTPSFTVSPELQIFKCFGCGKAGDVFTFIQEYEKVDFREALEELAKIAGVTLIKNVNVTQEELQKKTLVEINNQVARFYNYILTSHTLGSTALQYVLNRGITLETIKKFNIGFAPTNSQSVVNYLFKKGYKPKDLIATGTFAQNKYGASSLYDRFQGRLVFPLADYRDRVVGFSGRVLPSTANSNSAKYINSPETEIYHKGQMVYGLNFAKEAIRVNNSVIIVEGEFDMISPYQSGIQNIVALKGTAFTLEQLQLLRRYTDTLILALDSDFAGNNAARKSIELADSLEFDIKVLTLGDYKDPDEAVKSDLPFFQNQLQKTIPVWDFLIQSMAKMYDSDTIKGKKEILANILPFLIKINNSVIRSDYFKKLANEIGSSEEAVLQEAAKYLPAKTALTVGRPISFSPPVKEEPVNSLIEKFEEMLLILILGARKPAVLSRKLKKHLNSFSSHKFKVITDKLLEIEEFEPKSFQDTLPAEFQIIFQNIFFQATSFPVESTKRLSEIKKTINQIDIINLKDQLSKLSIKINHLETTNQEDDLHQVELEYNQLLLKLSHLTIKKR